jgi:hypothetical protein
MRSVHQKANDPAAGNQQAMARPAEAPDLDPLGGLQQTVGNRGMLHLLGSIALQSKLKTSQRSDPHEQAADGAAARFIGHHAGAVIQPKCETCATAAPCSECAEEETEPELQLKPAHDLMIQAAPATGATPATNTAKSAEADKEPTAKKSAASLIVEDDAQDLSPGQMRKSDFLSQLRTSVCSAAEAELAGTMWSAMGCPYIQRWFDNYQKRPAAYVERALRKYTPETASARSASEYIPVVTQRVRRGIGEWKETGQVSGLPEEFAGGEMPGATVGGLVSAGLSAIGSAVGGAVSSVGMLFKAREPSSGADADPVSVRSQLGSGQSLDTGVKRQMESAFGQSFSQVRVHADGAAGQLSEGLGARAFTVGTDVAFGAGEYKPGTPIGDALIAHELAHVVQQSGSNTSSAPMKKGGAAYQQLEEDADQAAVTAVVSQWSGKQGAGNIARSAMPRLKSGLGLSRCGGGGETSTKEKKTVTVNPTYLSGGSTALSSHLTKANEVFKPANVEVKEGKSETLDDTKSKAILGNDLELHEYEDVTKPTAEEQKLLKVNRTGSTITMYYVKKMSKNSKGEAFPPYSGQPVSFVYASPNSRTFPHELGHILLNSADHPKDADNFMHETDGASGKDIITQEQIKTLRSSSLLK